MPSLPHRFSEKSFRRYERIIAEVVTKFPQVVEVNPTHLELSPETVRGRLRDALSSFANNRWSSSIIDQDRFNAIHPEIVVSLRPDGTVAVGDKDTVKLKALAVFDAVNPSEIVDLSNTPRVDLSFLAFLAHHHALSKRIRVRPPSPETAQAITDNFDIVLDPQPDGTYLLS